MVLASKTEGGAQGLSPGVRRTIQSIKEIVGNHSDADIYVALKESNMDPNETAQRLLNQDPFHEVKSKRDKRKENSGYMSSIAAEPRKNTNVARMTVRNNAYFDRNVRKGGFGRNAGFDVGGTREFRVVRDNRGNQNYSTETKPAPISTSTSEGVISNGSIKRNSIETSGHQKLPVGQHSSQALNGPADSQPRQTKDATPAGNVRKEMLGEKGNPTQNTASRVQTKPNATQPHSANSSISSVVGVYSSSSDPIHVPSLHSRPAANVGAIRREIGVVGPRRQSSEISARPSSSQRTSLPNTQSVRDGLSKSDNSSHNMAPESAIPALPTSRSSASNQHGGRHHQVMGHQKASQPNKEWKPKATVKLNAAKSVSPPLDNPDFTKGAAEMQDNLSLLNVSENQNVIIAAHIRVSETDRSQLTFGSLGAELDTSVNSIIANAETAEELSTEPPRSVSVSAPEPSGNEPAPSKQSEMMDDSVRSSGAVSAQQPTEKKEAPSPSYTPESLQQKDTSDLPSFSGYDPQTGYDMSYFHPIVDETERGSGLPSSQEVLSAHTTNAIPASIAMVQQQQLAQMYPHLHVSHFANLMPYRQFLSPVYVPQMPVPGYSNNPAYPHPSNGNSYVMIPGNSSHITSTGVKYNNGFGNLTNPAGYAINTTGVAGSTIAHDDSSRLKYKDSVYLPNSQGETSEMWMNPRDLPGLQSASYYNMPGPKPQPAYLTSHGGQSSHMQFPGMYHTSSQPVAIPSHHLGPTIGGNIGAQVGAYQQSQLGHLNWTGTF